MESVPESPTTSTISRTRSRDTGFPPHFCGHRNTSLPHPDADTSPNAAIWGDDLTKLQSRNRRVFAKHHRTISHGRLAPDAMYSYINGPLSETASIASSNEGAKGDNVQSGGRSSKDVDSIGSVNGEDSPVEPRNTRQQAENSHRVQQEKRRSFMGRFLHK